MKKLLFIIEEGLPVVAVFIILAVSFIQVVFRYCLNNALPWPEELARMLMVTSTFIGCGIVAREGKHLEIDCAKFLFGLKLRSFVTKFSMVVTLFFCAVMFFLSIEMIKFVAESGQDAASFRCPYWIFWLSLPMGMALMAFRTVTHFRKELTEIKAQQSHNEEQACTHADILPTSRQS